MINDYSFSNLRSLRNNHKAEPSLNSSHLHCKMTAQTLTNGVHHSKLEVSQIERITQELRDDKRVKVAGVDCDGILRGKIMAKDKFLSSITTGFGMSSAVYGWDMHDVLYTTENNITSSETGYADFLAFPDLESFRRIPWEKNVPFFLLQFRDQGEPVSADGRSLLQIARQKAADNGWKALAGGKTLFTSPRLNRCG